MGKVSLSKVWKVYDGKIVAVSDVNLEIRDGEFMVLVGPSGCGKSTTLRMIAGLEHISSGEIAIDDVVVNDIPPRNRDIAMVFQSYALYPHMSVRENLSFGLVMRKMAAEEIGRRLARAVDILGLGDLLARQPKALSGGQRQRVAMGRAIVRDPKVFLFDEPLSNLDARMRVEMRKEIIKLHRRIGTTMIYVTHDQVEAMTLGDRICVMESGVIRQIGTPGEVFDNPENAFVAGFIGTPPMNLLEGGLDRSGGGGVFRDGDLAATLPPAMAGMLPPAGVERVFLGLRPKSFVFRKKAPADALRDVWTVMPEVAEMLGEESLVHVRAGRRRFVISVDPHDLPEMDRPLEICPLMNRAHIFDSRSGRNLSRGLVLPGRHSMRRI
ncbi:MAG: sn-glycerol-3-phosphate ABC transporter ATP-binding protein UgpC [Planctomycetota bacterium]|jgi:multiple sugar transport system ATP-binding protein|nr:sn-glycerol-3-phosphate ABC transporter ATP-binding protein UgpC [Planctomycetota bacterium]